MITQRICLLLRCFGCLWLAVSACVLSGGASAEVPALAGRTTLVMVDDINCGYCRKWDREVGVAYPKSEEGRFAPLTRLRRGDPRLTGIAGLAYTPTFILFVNGRESGRIVGYPGADFFWGQLEALIRRGGPAPVEQRTDSRGILVR